MPRVLGHSTHYREEKGVPAVKIGNVSPGGIVDVVIPRDINPELTEFPSKVTAVYIKAGTVPDHVNQTVESVLASGGLIGEAEVPKDGGNVRVKVEGVLPGDYDIQLILDYPDTV